MEQQELVGRGSHAIAGAGGIASHNRTAFRKWFYGLTFSYPLLWFVGAGGLYWLLLGVGAFLYLLRERLHWHVWVILSIPAVLVLSAPIGLMATAAEPTRLIGLTANVAVWVSVAAVVQLAHTGDESRQLSRAFAVLGLSQGAITAIAAAAYPTVLPVPLLRGLAPHVPGGIGAFMENSLYFASWLDGLEYRSAGIMAQPTWAGAVALLSLLASLHLLIRLREGGAWRWVALAALPMAAFSVSASLSRAATVGLVIALVAGLIVGVRRLSPSAFLSLVVAMGAALGIVLLTQLPALMTWVDAVNSQRVGSLYARGEIYRQTWELIRAHPFPLLGYGVKPETDQLVAPVATHSAYLGMLFRGGILGILLLVALYGALLWRSVAARSLWATTASVLIIAWSVFEDMDPGHLVPLGLALVVAWARSDQRTRSRSLPAPSALELRPTA